MDEEAIKAALDNLVRTAVRFGAESAFATMRGDNPESVSDELLKAATAELTLTILGEHNFERHIH